MLRSKNCTVSRTFFTLSSSERVRTLDGPYGVPCLAREVHDPVFPPFGRPRNFLIVPVRDLVRVVVIDEERLDRSRHRPVGFEGAFRVDVHAEVLFLSS